MPYLIYMRFLLNQQKTLPILNMLWWIVLIVILIFLFVFLVMYFYWNEPYPITSVELEEGRKEISNSRVVFAGLIRDNEEYVCKTRKFLEGLGKSFQDYRILIVENDSKDNTRKRLLRWQKQNPKVTILGCGVNARECRMNLEATKSKTHGSNRISKMAQLRNIYVDYVNEHFRDWDYLVVNDLDLVADLSNTGWVSTFGYLNKDPSLSAVSAYGYYDLWFKKVFYDDFAFVPIGSPIEIPNKKDISFKIGEKIEMESYLLETKKELAPVRSAFSGLTVYRISHISKDARYDYCRKENMKACEHSYFNQHLEKIVVHPGLKYRIIRNNT